MSGRRSGPDGIEPGLPASSRTVVHSISADMNAKTVTLLAIGQAVAFSQQAEGLQLTLPA